MHVFPVLDYRDSGFSLDIDNAPKLRGLVDLYDGSRHLYQCLIVASEEDGMLMRYEFKRSTAAVDKRAARFRPRRQRARRADLSLGPDFHLGSGRGDPPQLLHRRVRHRDAAGRPVDGNGRERAVAVRLAVDEDVAARLVAAARARAMSSGCG